MPDQLVASLYVHQQLVRLAHIVLGTNIVVFLFLSSEIFLALPG